MMHSPLMKILSMASWLITGLYALNEGLRHFGFDFYKLDFVAGNPKLLLVLSYVVGFAGLFSLITFVLAVLGKGCHCCGDSQCSCCSDDYNGKVCPHCGKSPCICK